MSGSIVTLNMSLVLVKSEFKSTSTKDEKEQFQRETIERNRWTVDDFATNLGFSNSGLDGRRDIGVELISDAHFHEVFGKKQGKNGWKIRPGDLLTAEECQNIREVYSKVYNHAPDNKEYTKVFLRAWLAHRDGNLVNWASYSFDTNRVQLGRLIQPMAKVTKENSGQEVRCKSKPSDAVDNDCIGEYLKEANMDNLKIQFKETQVSRVGLILQAAVDENVAQGPKMTMLETRKEDLESQAQSLECAMQERRKSQRREEEEKMALEEKRQLLKKTVESELPSSVIEEVGGLKGVDEVTTSIADELRKIECLCEFQDYHLQRECQKIAELTKAQALVKEELTRVLREYNGMHFKFGQLKSWMQIL